MAHLQCGLLDQLFSMVWIIKLHLGMQAPSTRVRTIVCVYHIIPQFLLSGLQLLAHPTGIFSAWSKPTLWLIWACMKTTNPYFVRRPLTHLHVAKAETWTYLNNFRTYLNPLKQEPEFNFFSPVMAIEFKFSELVYLLKIWAAENEYTRRCITPFQILLFITRLNMW